MVEDEKPSSSSTYLLRASPFDGDTDAPAAEFDDRASFNERHVHFVRNRDPLPLEVTFRVRFCFLSRLRLCIKLLEGLLPFRMVLNPVSGLLELFQILSLCHFFSPFEV